MDKLTSENNKLNLFQPLQLGCLTLPNRIVMAPMTRGRALADGTPTEIMRTYYRQRASAGLIITEATSISVQGSGWLNAPGVYNRKQRDAWRPIVDDVHAAGGRIFLQLWHMGRVSHPDFLAGELPVAPSAISASGETQTPSGPKPYVVPRALRPDELPQIVEDYAKAARLAVQAGFDGVEIHAANGYLLDQFIRDGSNQRTDEYGGSATNRWRFPREVVRAVIDEVGAARTGFRVSPTGLFNSMSDSDPLHTFCTGAQLLNDLGLVYLHVIEPVAGHFMANPDAQGVLPSLRKLFEGVILLNGGYDKDRAQDLLQQRYADAVAFGIPFLANPDLPHRFQTGATLNKPQPETFYTPGIEGYTDYPALEIA